MTNIGSDLIPRSDSLAVNFSHAKKINLPLNKQTAKTKDFFTASHFIKNRSKASNVKEHNTSLHSENIGMKGFS